MPELPEVEHAARCLRRWLGGAVIARAEADASRVLRGGGTRRAFARSLPGRRLERVERRGKVLLLFFDADVGLLSHLGMTGRWLETAAHDAPQHSHARLGLEGGRALHYCDPRMFGRLALHPASALLGLPEVRALGPDPLHDGIDAARLHGVLAKTGRAVKVALMDQGVLAGVGNIYATEALFRARVHPTRAASSLSRREVGRVAEGIEAAMGAVLAEMKDELAYLSDGAHVENPFLIYDRAGAPCPRCGRVLEKVTIGGRVSAFCGRCQKAG
jgi:formamidopyrimidine-DNA glycosylase